MNRLSLVFFAGVAALSLGAPASAQFSPFDGGRLHRDAFGDRRDPFGQDSFRKNPKELSKPIKIEGLPSQVECPAPGSASQEQVSEESETALFEDAPETAKAPDDATAASEYCY